MKEKHLKTIKQVYDDLERGISNPIIINTAYTYLPNYIEGAPIRAKIMAITRFMMLSYADEIKTAEKDEVQPTVGIEESIGTIENLPKQSHSEISISTTADDIRGFLTSEEKLTLAAPVAGTTLEIEKDGKKKRTRSPNKRK